MLFDIVVDKTPTSLTSLGETVFGGRLPSPARQLRVPRGAQPGQPARHHQLLLALTLLQGLGHGRVLQGEVRVQGQGVPRVLQAHPGEFLEEKFEFKDEEYLKFSKQTQVSS